MHWKTKEDLYIGLIWGLLTVLVFWVLVWCGEMKLEHIKFNVNLLERRAK